MEVEDSKSLKSSGGPMLALPQISEYSSYRTYIRDFFLYRKSQRPSFSMRKFAQLAGLKSPNYLQLVIQGKKNLSIRMIEPLGNVLKLKKSEQKYFAYLIQIESAKTTEEKRAAEKLKLAALRELKTKVLPAAQYQVLETWYHMLVRELVLLKEFTPTGDWISERLGKMITPTQAEESLSLLVRSGFLQIVDRKYVVSDPVISTDGGNFKEVVLQKHHSETLKVWSQSIAEFGGPDQELGLSNIPVSRELLAEIKTRVQNFQDEIIGLVQDEKNATQVIQLGIYLMPFPVVEVGSRKT